jgi:hypothetical protein
MPRFTKDIIRDDFKFSISETLCGSLAYVFYCRDTEVLKNNNYFPNEKAMTDENTMLKELVTIVVREEKLNIRSEVEKKFLESDDFIKLKKLIAA